MLFEMWGIRCVVTGVDQKELLIGAHIKPFSKSDDSEKIDEYNSDTTEQLDVNSMKKLLMELPEIQLDLKSKK